MIATHADGEQILDRAPSQPRVHGENAIGLIYPLCYGRVASAADIHRSEMTDL